MPGSCLDRIDGSYSFISRAGPPEERGATEGVAAAAGWKAKLGISCAYDVRGQKIATEGA